MLDYGNLLHLLLRVIPKTTAALISVVNYMKNNKHYLISIDITNVLFYLMALHLNVKISLQISHYIIIFIQIVYNLYNADMFYNILSKQGTRNK